MRDLQAIAEDVRLGDRVKIARFVNLYGCEIGSDSKVGAFVEIQRGASVGQKCKVSSHTFICEGVRIGDCVFIGHGVVFINDLQPCAATPEGELETDADWAHRFVKTNVQDHASIGSNATILGGVTIGRGALVGAGSVVTRDVPAGEVWAGNPARRLRKRNQQP